MPESGKPSNSNKSDDRHRIDAAYLDEIKRRELLSAAAAGGVTFLAGCGGQEPDDTGGDDTDGDDTDGDDTDGDDTDGGQSTSVYVAGMRNDPAHLDPHAIPQGEDVAYMIMPPNGYETLVHFEPTSPNLIPLLASEIPTNENGLISEDDLTFEFPLREGVQFHTGGEMLAEDVKYSWERALTMGLSDGLAGLNRIDEIEVADDYRLQVTLKERYGPFLNSDVPGVAMSVISKQAVENNGGVLEGQPNEWVAQNTAGTGPYVLREWNRGENLQFDYFEDYWDPDSVNIKGGVHQVIIPETGTDVARMQRGELHRAGGAAAEFDAYEGIDGVKLEFYDVADASAIHFNYDIPYDRDEPSLPDSDTVPPDFFADRDVRLGIAYSIDYDAYIDDVWQGHASRMANFHMPATTFFSEDMPMYQQDLERAEEHFRNAGYWEDGFTVTITSETIPQFENGMAFIKDQLESLNPRFEVPTISFSEAVHEGEYHAQRTWSFPWEAHGFLPLGPDPAVYYTQLFIEGSGNPVDGSGVLEYVDQEVIDLVEEGNRETDPERRQEIYSQLAQINHEECYYLPLAVEDAVAVTQECVNTTLNGVFTGHAVKRQDISQCDNLNINV